MDVAELAWLIGAAGRYCKHNLTDKTQAKYEKKKNPPESMSESAATTHFRSSDKHASNEIFCCTGDTLPCLRVS